jgi:hypothetical protein
LRLNKELTSKQIQMLDRKYCDILASGTISSCKPTPEEIKSNDHLDKFRLSLMFNKHDYGRLMMMIHDINRL